MAGGAWRSCASNRCRQRLVAFQKDRGAEAEILDIIEGDIGGPYEGIVAMYVLQHIDRHLLPVVFSKIAQAISENGVFLFSIQEGDGEYLTERVQSDAYYVVKWKKSNLTKLYIPLGFKEVWSAASEDSEGRWITTILIKGVAA